MYNGTVWSIYAAFSVKMEVWLLRRMLNRILNISYRRVGGRRSGEWITRLNDDIQTAIILMNGPMNIPHLVVAIINTVLSIILMQKGNIVMLVVTILHILPHLYLNNRVVLKQIPQLKEASQWALEESTSAIKPLITDADVICVYDVRDLMMRKCEESSIRLMKTNMKIHIRNAVSDVITRLFGLGGYLAVLMIGVYFMDKGIMAFSDVTYCFQVRGSIMTGIFTLMICSQNIKANLISVKRINEIFEE